jgi:hypothetical protein
MHRAVGVAHPLSARGSAASRPQRSSRARYALATAAAIATAWRRLVYERRTADTNAAVADAFSVLHDHWVVVGFAHHGRVQVCQGRVDASAVGSGYALITQGPVPTRVPLRRVWWMREPSVLSEASEELAALDLGETIDLRRTPTTSRRALLPKRQ